LRQVLSRVQAVAAGTGNIQGTKSNEPADPFVRRFAGLAADAAIRAAAAAPHLGRTGRSGR
jgi:hypothetical protein